MYSGVTTLSCHKEQAALAGTKNSPWAPSPGGFPGLYISHVAWENLKVPKEMLADVSGDDWTRLLVSKVLRNADG